MHLNRFAICVLALTSVLGCSSGGGEADNGGTGGSDVDFTSFEWTELNGDAPWSRRAGLHTVELAGRFYLMGGRTPTDPMGAMTRASPGSRFSRTTRPVIGPRARISKPSSKATRCMF